MGQKAFAAIESAGKGEFGMLKYRLCLIRNKDHCLLLKLNSKEFSFSVSRNNFLFQTYFDLNYLEFSR
ncbi:hypothetical protein BB776_00430 [Planococcus salinarum]|uniref:Uncharacterized protein n=1 Tax=Planococcus salinarum TaxID=622695 RepID=A0ABX3D1I7_9BACL|nr:hypothetical protein BB776_00430 [Planococcus salinarum]